MKERSEITDLFHSHLRHAEMEVRDGFWEMLEQDLSVPPHAGRRHISFPRWGRWAVAASILLIVGAAGIMFHSHVPEIEEQTVSHHPLALSTEQEPPRQDAESSERLANATTSGLLIPASQDNAEEDGQVSVHVSVTITQHQYARRGMPGYAGRYRPTTDRAFHARPTHEEPEESFQTTASVEDCGQMLKNSRWALKPSIGASWPLGGFRTPLTAGISVERRLSKRLSVEAGLQYSSLEEKKGETLHTLGIPLKLNIMLAEGRKWDIYALAGGMIEKCVSGAPDNSFKAEPVQGSLMAGIGVRYKLSERLALFAEPTVSHHFDSDSPSRTLRTEYPVNVNLLCGVRMTY